LQLTVRNFTWHSEHYGQGNAGIKHECGIVKFKRVAFHKRVELGERQGAGSSSTNNGRILA